MQTQTNTYKHIPTYADTNEYTKCYKQQLYSHVRMYVVPVTFHLHTYQAYFAMIEYI